MHVQRNILPLSNVNNSKLRFNAMLQETNITFIITISETHINNNYNILLFLYYFSFMLRSFQASSSFRRGSRRRPQTTETSTVKTRETPIRGRGPSVFSSENPQDLPARVRAGRKVRAESRSEDLGSVESFRNRRVESRRRAPTPPSNPASLEVTKARNTPASRRNDERRNTSRKGDVLDVSRSIDSVEANRRVGQVEATRRSDTVETVRVDSGRRPETKKEDIKLNEPNRRRGYKYNEALVLTESTERKQPSQRTEQKRNETSRNSEALRSSRNQAQVNTDQSPSSRSGRRNLPQVSNKPQVTERTSRRLSSRFSSAEKKEEIKNQPVPERSSRRNSSSRRQEQRVKDERTFSNIQPRDKSASRESPQRIQLDLTTEKRPEITTNEVVEKQGIDAETEKTAQNTLTAELLKHKIEAELQEGTTVKVISEQKSVADNEVQRQKIEADIRKQRTDASFLRQAIEQTSNRGRTATRVPKGEIKKEDAKNTRKDNQRARGRGRVRSRLNPLDLDDQKLEVLPLFESEEVKTVRKSPTARSSNRSFKSRSRFDNIEDMEVATTDQVKVTVKKAEFVPSTTASSVVNSRRQTVSVRDELILKDDAYQSGPVRTRIDISEKPIARTTVKESVQVSEITEVTSKKKIGRKGVRKTLVSTPKPTISNLVFVKVDEPTVSVSQVISRGTKKAEVKVSAKSSEEIDESDNYPEAFKALIKAKEQKVKKGKVNISFVI